MSTELRALMRDLADSVPYTGDDVSLADRSYAAGRRRRRVRHLEITSASTLGLVLLLLGALFVGPTPLAAQYGASGGATVQGYPSHIGEQWPVLDLPAKPGPIAGLLAYREGWWAVSPTGHRWHIPGPDQIDGALPGLSGDGRVLGYVDSERHQFVLHDLVSGRTTRVAGFGPGAGSMFSVQDESPILFSADDRYLAVAGHGAANGSTVVIDVRAGKVLTIAATVGFPAGFAGDRLVTTDGRMVQLQSVVDGSLTQLRLQALPTLAPGGQNAASLAMDGSQLVYLNGLDSARTSNRPQTLARFDLRTGAEVGSEQVVPSVWQFCTATGGDKSVYTHRDPSSQTYSVVVVDAARQVSTTTSIDSALDPYCGIWAARAFHGQPRRGLALDRLDDQLVRWHAWIWWILGVVGLGLLVGWRVRVAVRQRPLDHPGRTRPRRSLPRRLFLAAGVVVAVGVVLGLVTSYVLVPETTDRLVAGQPPIWWSPIDQRAAQDAGTEGDPTTQVPERPGQDQGFAVLVTNPTSRALRVSEPDPTGYQGSLPGGALTVATTGGTAAQARSLTYRSNVTIPPHQARWVHFPHHTQPCGGDDKGGIGSIASAALAVHLGWVTRTETIALRPAVAWLGVCKV